MVIITIYAEQSALKDIVDHCLLINQIEDTIIILGIAIRKTEILIKVVPAYYLKVNDKESVLVTILFPPNYKTIIHSNEFCQKILKIIRPYFEELGITHFKIHSTIRSLADGIAESY